MIKSRNRTMAIALSALALAALPALASAQSAQAPTITDSRASGDWMVRCIRAQIEICELAQFSVQKSSNVKVAGVEINYIAKSDTYLGRFSVPLGVSFEKGMGLEVGTYRIAGLNYRVCESDGCYVTGTLPADLVAAMKDPSTQKGFLDFQMVDGRKAQIPIALNGFADGLELLKKWTLAKAGTPDKPVK